MDGRRWHAFTRIDMDGVSFRTSPGNRCPHDLRLDWTAGGQWRPVNMRIGALFADFYGHNEDNRYPPPGAGHNYYFAYLWRAYHNGWDLADRRLQDERDGNP